MSAYRNILVPTDGSPLSLKGARQAAALAHDAHARITALYVVAPWVPPLADESTVAATFELTQQAYHQQTEAHAKKALDKVAAIAKDARVPCEGVVANDAQPWESIITTARRKHCDLIVMGSHGRGHLGGLLLGSETTKVLTHSKTPVLVCR